MLLRSLAIALVVVFVSGASVAAWVFWDLTSNVNSNAIDISRPDGIPLPTAPNIDAFEGGFNLLVVGADNDPEQGSAFGEREVTLNDVNMLLHVSEDHSSAVVVSFPRDLVIPHPTCTDLESGEIHEARRALALNAAFERGGLACVVATISDLTGLDIEYAAQMSFASVVRMTDAVGGVPVCLTAPIKDSLSGLDLPAGTSVISGASALAFLRNRHGVGDGSDLSRIANQQQYISSLIRKIKSDDTLTDVTKLYSLAQVAAKHVYLSTSLTNITQMVAMARTLQTIDLDKLNLIQYPVMYDPDNPNRVIPLQDLADELFERIAADRPFLPDPNTEREGVEQNPDAAAPTMPPETAPATPPATSGPVPTGTPGATPAPAPTTDVIEGLQGQTALDETCSVAN
ncbi:LCP family protein [Mycetocola sp.]|uniref:LCP family protein n=1 Tax=Mycetocola sp. TaxID=1871042 RepID=UPI00398A38B0